jgi:hypothetical protein
MAITNRDFDASAQTEKFFYSSGTIGVSQLINIAVASLGCAPVVIYSQAFGLSGSPIVGLQIQRFIAGAGLTTIQLNGSSLTTITAYSTSGAQSLPLPFSFTSKAIDALSYPGFVNTAYQASSLLFMNTGDVLQVVTSGANSAAQYCFQTLFFVLEDIRNDFKLGIF